MNEVMKGQSLPDMSIQETGRLENIVGMAIENNLSVTDSLESIRHINIHEAAVPDKSVLVYYRTRDLKPATGLVETVAGEGVEYWIVERDFIIS